MGEAEFDRYYLLSLSSKSHDAVIDHEVAIGLSPTQLGTEPDYRQKSHREAHTPRTVSRAAHHPDLWDRGHWWPAVFGGAGY
jgi:hypothetical protein